MRKLLLFLTLLPFFAIAQAPTDDSTQFSPNVAFTPQTWKYKGSNYSNMRFQFNIPGTTKWPQFVTGYQFNHFIGSATAAAIAGLTYTAGQGLYKVGNVFNLGVPYGSGLNPLTGDREVNTGIYTFRIGSDNGYVSTESDNTTLRYKDLDYNNESQLYLYRDGAYLSTLNGSTYLNMVSDSTTLYSNNSGRGIDYVNFNIDRSTENTLIPKGYADGLISGLGSTYLTKAGNLSGLTNTQSARANIGTTYASTTNISDFLTVWTLGDSFTSSGYPDTLAAITSRPLIKAGISGNTSGEIITRFRSDPAKWKYTTILAGVGRNDFLIDSGVIKRRVDSMVVSLRSVGNNRFIITPIFNANYPSEWKDSTSYNRIKGINQYWAAKYPNNYVDVRSYLVTTYSTGVYLTHDVTAPLIRSDSLHLTNFAYGQMARYIISQKLNSLSDSTRVVLTPENLPTIFDSPPAIGRIAPSAATFSSLNVRKTPTSPARWATEIAGSGATERYTYKGYNTAGTEIYSFDPLNGATINNLTTFGTSTYGWDVSPAGSPISRFVLIGRNAASGTVISFDPSTTNTIKNTTSFVTGSSSMQFVPTSTRTRLLSSNASGTNIGSFDPIGHSYWANGSDFTFGSTTDKGFTLGVTGRIGTDNLRVTTLTTPGIMTNASTGEVGSVAVIPAANGGAGTLNGILKANGSGLVSAAVSGTDYVAPSALTGYVPTARTLTPTYGGTGGGDLSANRTFGPDTTIIATKPHVAANYLKNGSASYLQRLSLNGTAGNGYLDLISQSISPATLTGHLRLYSDSLNRLSWKNSTYRRTIQVPFPLDATIRMPYLANPTLVDSTQADAKFLRKTGGNTADGVQYFTSTTNPYGGGIYVNGYNNSTTEQIGFSTNSQDHIVSLNMKAQGGGSNFYIGYFPTDAAGSYSGVARPFVYGTGITRGQSTNAGQPLAYLSDLNYSQTKSYRAITSATTIVPSDDYTIDATSGTFTQPIPVGSSSTLGQIYVIKNSGAGTITVTVTGGGTIDGASSVVLASGDPALVVQQSGSVGAYKKLSGTGSGGGGSGTVTNVSSATSDITVANPSTAPVITLNGLNGITKTYYDPTSSIQTQLNVASTKINTKLDSALNKATINKVNGKLDSARFVNVTLPTLVLKTTSPITLPSKNSKNLFNQYYVTLGRGILSGTGGMSNFTAPGRLSNKITIGAGVQFTISYTATATGKYIGYYTSAGALIGSAVQWGNTGTSFTATTPANTAYLYFTASIGGGDSGTSDLNTLQFELGGTATTYEAPEDPIKLIAFGTSISLGFNVASPAIYFGTTMQSALQPMLGRSVTVFNSGVAGNTSTQMLARLPAMLTANPNLTGGPNVVFIEVSVNDTKSASNIIPQTTEANMRTMIGLIQAAGMIPIIVTPPPIDPTNPLSSEPTMDVNKWHSCLAIARRLGKELNIRVADVTTMMGKSDVTVSPDVLHPSSTYGQWLLAQAYLGALYN